MNTLSSYCIFLSSLRIYTILPPDSTKPIILKTTLHRALLNSQMMFEAFHLLSLWKVCLAITFLSLPPERDKSTNGVVLLAPSQPHLNLLNFLSDSATWRTSFPFPSHREPILQFTKYQQKRLRSLFLHHMNDTAQKQCFKKLHHLFLAN